MNVLMFGWEFPPFNSGGLGVACEGLVTALARRGIGVNFVLPKKIDIREGPVRFVFADHGIRRREVSSLLTAYATPESYMSAHADVGVALYGNTLFDEVRRYARRARAIAKREKFDVIHAHDWLSFAAGVEAKAVTGKPLIVHVHATEFDRTGGHNVNSFVYALEREGMEKADAVIAVSNFTKNIIVHRYGIPPEKVHVIHNAVDAALFSHATMALRTLTRDGGRIVLFLGRITLQKGPDYFLRMAKRVAEVLPNTIFIMAGSGDMERRMIEDAASMGLADRVLFAGFVRGAELQSLYQAADVYVLPSVSEPFGITPLESLRHGTPVILSKQSGVSEVLAHALKVDFWDIDEMTNKIVAVLREDALRVSLGRHGRQETEQMTWDTPAALCVELYRSVLVSEPAAS